MDSWIIHLSCTVTLHNPQKMDLLLTCIDVIQKKALGAFKWTVHLQYHWMFEFSLINSDSGCGRWEIKDAYLACSCPCVYAVMRVVWYLVHDFSLHFQIAKSWTSRGVKTFEKLASKRMLKVAVVSYDHFTMSYRVALYHGCVPLGLWESSAVFC